MSKTTLNFWLIILIIIGFVGFYALIKSNSNNEYQLENSDSETEEINLTPRQAINEHWDEIKEYVNGEGITKACYDYGEKCYTLKVDLESGGITNVYFPNGGYLDFDEVELNSEGHGEATSIDEREWDFDLDLDNDAVYTAINEWAENSEYSITYDPPDQETVSRYQERLDDEYKRNGKSLEWFGRQGDIEDLYQGDIDTE